jgi:hypothetical protein
MDGTGITRTTTSNVRRDYDVPACVPHTTSGSIGCGFRSCIFRGCYAGGICQVHTSVRIACFCASGSVHVFGICTIHTGLGYAVNWHGGQVASEEGSHD